MNINENKLHQIAARFINNEPINANITGSEIQIETLNILLNVSKELMQEIKKSNMDYNKITSLIEDKKRITKKFQNLTGITWRL